jgi:hypothetical protein
VVAVLWQDHDTLRRVLEIKSDHGPSVAACPVADCGADLAPRLSPAVPAGLSLALKRIGKRMFLGRTWRSLRELSLPSH